MTASRLDEWTERDVADLEAWRQSLAVSLRAALSPETTVEFLTYSEPSDQTIRRFVNIYDGLTESRIEVIYPEPIEAIVARALEATNEHTD